MEYKDYNEWQREQTLDPSWTDHHDKAVGDEMKGQFVTTEKMLSVKAIVDRDLKVNSVPSIDPLYKSGNSSFRWMLTFNHPNGTPVTVAVGVLVGEMSKPYGWADSDKTYHYIGMGAPGRLVWDAEKSPSTDGCPVAWLPDPKPKPVTPAPTNGASWADLANAVNGYDNGNFTNQDRAVLRAVKAQLDALYKAFSLTSAIVPVT